jgi:Flp pilus assembly protein TadD
MAWLRASTCVAAASLLCAMGWLSWRQTQLYQNSERLWTTMLARDPTCWVAYNSLGMAKLQRGDTDGAIADWTKELALSPNDASIESNLGAAYRRTGRIDEAIAHCQRAITLAPHDAAAHNGLANALREDGRIAEAAEHYEQAMQSDPRGAQAANNLAWVLATCPDDRIRNPGRAIEAAQKAVQITGGRDPITLRTLAAAYASAGRFDEAGQTIERALSQIPPQANMDLVQSLLAQQTKYRQSIAEQDLSLVPRNKTPR